MINQCEWCLTKFSNFLDLHHHVHKDHCPNDPWPEMRKS